jgi:hypothetical protein
MTTRPGSRWPCDAVTAAFAAIAQTKHLLFIRDLIAYMLARPLMIG